MQAYNISQPKAMISNKGQAMRVTFWGWMHRNNPSRCNYCGRTLSDLEKKYYLHRCERCERKILRQLSHEKGKRNGRKDD